MAKKSQKHDRSITRRPHQRPRQRRPHLLAMQRRLLMEHLESRVVLDGHGLLHVSFAPDTPMEYAEAVMQRAEAAAESPEFAAFQFSDTDRWSATTTSGGGLSQGDGTTVTWSIVPDGTSIYGYNNEATSPSDLRAKLNGIYGSINTWLPLFEQSFDRLSELSGVNYVYEPNDDGSAWTSTNIASGQLGVRGDVRISGHNIDGGSGVLAYNFFPNFSDMVIDTGDVTSGFFANTSANSLRLRQVLMHEAGHGLGISHVESNNGQFLMEPFINLNFDGPQFDDVLGMHRGYGDANEFVGNDSSANATPLGSINAGESITIGADADDLGVAPADVDFVSIDDNSDADYYSITIGADSALDIDLTPLGPTYSQGPQGGFQSTFVASAQNDLSLAVIDRDGNTVLAAANSSGLGGSESLSNVTVATAGQYYLRVTGSQNAAQMYQLSLSVESNVPSPGVTITPAGGGLALEEGGASDSYTVVLNTAPSSPVTVAFTADSQLTATAASNPLIFDASNWQTPQQITVIAIDDEVIEGNHSGNISHSISSTDPDYSGLTVPVVTATIADNDIAPAQLYFSLQASGNLNGLSVADEDIVAYNGTDFELLFDGSDVGLGGLDVNAFSVISSTEILLSFTAAGTVGGFSVDDSDIVKFTASSLGNSTQGSFSRYLDGSDVGLSSNGEDIDALDVLENGDLLISTTGSFSGNGASGADEDIFRFTPSNLGSQTSGSFSLYLDSSDLGLGGSSEDIDSLGLGPAGTLNISTAGNLSASGVSRADEDVSLLTVTSTGGNSGGSIASTPVFDGSLFGLVDNDVNAVDIPSGPADTEAPEVQVTAPNGGEQWAAGSTQTITWAASDDVGVTSVDIKYSADGGQTFTTLAAAEANDGSYSWAVPNAPTTTGLIQVTAVDAAGNATSDNSNTTFSIVDATQPAVTVNTPNGGENWSVGSVQNITWTATDNVNVTAIDINFSADNGNNFSAVAAGQSNTGTFAWTVPSTVTSTAIIQVIARDAAGNVAADSSNSTFVISEPDTTAPLVNLTAPNGGEIWGSGSSQTILWTATDNVAVSAINLSYSLNNGNTFTTIATGETNDGEYQWTVPNSVSETAIIRVTASDTSGNQATDQSNNIFAIRDETAPSVTITSPNGGEAWTVGSTQIITWVANDNLGVSQVDIYYSANGGTTFAPVAIGETNDGSYSWSVPTTPTDTGVVRIIARDAAGNATADESDGNFRITEVNNTDVLYFSTENNISFAGLTVRDEDIVSYDGSSFQLAFDGSDVGVGGLDIDAFAILNASEILMSFTAAGTVGNLSFDDSDILKFTATQLGTNTAGSFSLHFDGSDVGLTGNGEDIDALSVLPDGRLVISTTGGFSGTGASGNDEDLFVFDASSLGSNTAGSFSIFFDGSDVGMTARSEDIDAVHVSASGEISLSTNGDLAAGGINSVDEDIVLFTSISLGGTTNGNFDSSLVLDGSAFGLEPTDINALDRPTTPLTVGTINLVSNDTASDSTDALWPERPTNNPQSDPQVSPWECLHARLESAVTALRESLPSPSNRERHVKDIFTELGERTAEEEPWGNCLQRALDEWFTHLGR